MGWLAFYQVQGGDVDGALLLNTAAQLPSHKTGLTAQNVLAFIPLPA